MDDPRYSELLFLRQLANESSQFFQDQDGSRARAIGLSPNMYVDMAATLVEDLYARFDREDVQLIVARLRGEVPPTFKPDYFHAHEWNNPRETLQNVLAGIHRQGLQRLRVTYRGLRRIEELRDLLRRDRVLEPFGILLDMRYFVRDLEEALARPPDVPVSVIYADMDNFKPINDQHGHPAGDVVMKEYLQIVLDVVGQFGTAYRGRGDETACLIIGLGHQRAAQIAETIRKKIAGLSCDHNGKKLPKVTASIGVASTPPETRSAGVETVADDRNSKAKKAGKNCIVSS